MQTMSRLIVVPVLLLHVTSASAQPSGVMGDLFTLMSTLETKVVGLAKAIPESAYGWRPGDGVRSVGEVFIHVAADNYFAAANLGGQVTPETGITGKSYKEAETYEARQLSRAETIAALEQSFALQRRAMEATTADRLETISTYFGPKRPTTVRRAWVGATTHLHEHLGQLIAYARSNKVVPPWSK
jgi:uncharacterized damage-inducible protein DinB